MATYIHQCPFCHTIHQNQNQVNEWCPEHTDRFWQYQRRGREKNNWDYSWLCPGCDKCEEQRDYSPTGSCGTLDSAAVPRG